MKGIADWLETHWVTPAYSGWLLLGLSVFFFAAASNTMAGWLYVISGTTLAILAIAAVLPERTLRHLKIVRRSISPVHAGDPLVIELAITNTGRRSKDLLQVTDLIPYVLGSPPKKVIETLPSGKTYHWVYAHATEQRGIYSWKELQLRTAAPLGLFWCRRHHATKAQAVVYPQILHLSRCPILDEVGETSHTYVEQYTRSNQSHEGFTRALRPYRWGDPIRLVHWRTSARYGELRVRELEILTGGQEVIIALDPAGDWVPEHFEQAVITAATLYDYGDRNGMSIGVWTATSGLVYPRVAVLTSLAKIRPNDPPTSELPHHAPIIWLTNNTASMPSSPNDTYSVAWPPATAQTVSPASVNGSVAPHSSSSRPLPVSPASPHSMTIDPKSDLAAQLQRAI